jgi:DNA-binding CsgD family transcriptional regulator
LDRLLEGIRAGESATLVVRGEAGIGKTALLDHFAEQASGLRLARFAGIESEIELPFAGLQQLCAPMFAEVDGLPDPQQQALRVAFGLRSGDVPDRLLVALATLSLLAEVAQKQPLLCIVDDAQWLDEASSQIFGFVARRLLAESVMMVLAVREPAATHHLDGLPTLRLNGLTDPDARALLVAATPGRIDVQVRDRIVAETRGNPLALLELPKGMTAAELAGGFPVPRTRDLPGQLEEHYLKRFEALPDATQRLILIAAIDPTGDVGLLWRAAQTLGIERNAAGGLEAGGLIEIGTRVQFRHPLVRSAIYTAASSQELRTAHLAVVAAMDPQTEPDRRAWHRALAATGADEEIASELEQSASRAQSRGGLASAAAFFERSVVLTRDPQRRADRALAAAQAQLHAGEFDKALGLLVTAEAGPLDEAQGAQVDLLRGQIAFAAGTGSDAPSLLLNAARRLEPLDVDLARETYLNAWAAAMFAADLVDTGDLREVSRAARAAPAPAHPPRAVDLLLDGLALMVTDGLAVAAPALRQVEAAFAGTDTPVEERLRWAWLANMASEYLWDADGWLAITTGSVQLGRDIGALYQLPISLQAQAVVVMWCGDFPAAAALIAEARLVCEATGTLMAPFAAMFLAALRGRDADAGQLIESVLAEAMTGGQGTAVTWARWMTGILCNGLARYADAEAATRQASQGMPEIIVLSWALPELIEAAARTGNIELATSAMDQLTEATQPGGTDWGLGVEARCRALVSHGQAAEGLYREAIERLGRTRLRPELARAHLLYGEWLRGQNRRNDARVQLRTAYDIFNEIGMLAFAERTRHELHATGETVRKRRDATRNDLTPQEEQIARLARGGRTNPEIGAQLFISARTVEWHLRKVFAKLGITSRRELRDALPAQPSSGLSD